MLVVDPPGCGCTECFIGFSVPADMLTEAQKDRVVDNKIVDSTGFSGRDWDERLA